MNRLKIGCDIDDVLADWSGPFFKRFSPKNDSEITRICNQKLSKDRKFWLNLPVLRRPIGFEPELYCTKRFCLKTYSKEWLDDNNFPHKPVYQMLFQWGNKADYVRGKCDLFIDDSPTNFIQMNLSGVPCLLMDAPYNQHLGPILRIHSLDYDEIEEVYYLAKETNVFKEFNLYYDN